MFDFEKLDLYHVVRNVNADIFTFLNGANFVDSLIIEQWKKATLGILMNLAEGTGRIAVNDKKQFITMARGNVNESVALLQLSKDQNAIEEEKYEEFYSKYEQISKMLLGMFRSYSNKKD
jgi:four helix bundle protein